MSIYKPKGSSWFHYDFIVGGVRFYGSTGTANREAAKQAEARKRVEAATAPKAGRPQMAINAAAERFYQDVAQHQASASDVDRWLTRLVTSLGPATLLSEITDPKLAEIVAKRRGMKARGRKVLVSPGTVNRDTIELLRRVMRRADSVWKVDIGTDPPDWGKHLLAEPEERVREASYGEEARLFAHLRADLRPLVRFAILSGCRLGELRRLTWPTVDFERMEIRVIGKSQKPGGKVRIVPLTGEMVALLQGCRGQHETHVFTFVCERPRTHADGSARRKGERYPISRDGWRRLWADALEAAGIADFRLHDTRHTSATRTLRASGNLKAVMKQLGHADIKTTAKYAHVTTDDVRSAMEAASRNSPEAVPDSDQISKSNQAPK